MTIGNYCSVFDLKKEILEGQLIGYTKSQGTTLLIKPSLLPLL
jgi:hypothetical protein